MVRLRVVGRSGEVVRVMPKQNRVLVSGVNMVKRHTKPDPGRNKPGGIVEKEAPIHVSNVAMFNPGTGKADRVGFKSLEDGSKVRIFKSTKEVVDV